MDLIDAAAILTGSGRERQETATPTVGDVTTIAEAVSDSADGLVMVDLGGESITEDDVQEVEAECTCEVRAGDIVSVTMTGARGRGMTCTVTGVVGGGDRTHTEVVAADEKATTAQTTAAAAKQDVEEIKPRIISVETRIVNAEDAITLEAETRMTTDDALANLGAQLDAETASRIERQDELATQLNDEITTRKNWFRFDEKGAELGESTSDFKTRITNRELGFYNGDVKLASASGDSFEAPKLASELVSIGAWVWTTTTSGNLVLKYAGNA
ncbi:hypothetical protein ACUYFE_08490 [Olegusella massiliensis]|uniref:hypothetical protein n=1 Tax=Olegusella massiliensis TaxID=1776381 RepID=UPI0040559AE9